MAVAAVVLLDMVLQAQVHRALSVSQPLHAK